MRKMVPLALLLTALAAPVQAGIYPVSGKWGQSSDSAKGPINCAGKRVITFNGDQRQDSNGGVPAYRNKSVKSTGSTSYRVVDQFTTGLIGNGSVSYTLQMVDDDHIVMQLQQGGTIKLARCN